MSRASPILHAEPAVRLQTQERGPTLNATEESHNVLGDKEFEGTGRKILFSISFEHLELLRVLIFKLPPGI